MSKYRATCPMCAREFTTHTMASHPFCSVGCQFDASEPNDNKETVMETKTYAVDVNVIGASQAAAELTKMLDVIDAPKTRLIGIATIEHAALSLGATMIIGETREGMEPIEVGQELLCIVGHVPGNEPRMDTPRVRVRVSSTPYEVALLDLYIEQVARVTGNPVRSTRALADIDLTAFLQGVCAELKSFDPTTPKLAIPVEVVK